MTELTLSIDNPALLPSLRKVLSCMEGVTIKSCRSHKTGIEEALDDAAAGRISSWNSAEEMFNALMSDK